MVGEVVCGRSVKISAVPAVGIAVTNIIFRDNRSRIVKTVYSDIISICRIIVNINRIRDITPRVSADADRRPRAAQIIDNVIENFNNISPAIIVKRNPG